MHVWVIKTFDREDCYCEYDSDIVAVYSKANFSKARQHFKRVCDGRIDKGDDIERWKNDKGYHFSCNNGGCENYRMSYVGLVKMEVQ